MSIDWGSALLDPLYGTLGVPATLAVPTVTALLSVTAIDETSGAVIDQGKLGLETIQPGCSLRVRELTALGVTRPQLIGGHITLRPGTSDQADWRIESAKTKPSPSGEAAGELQLILVKP